MHLKFVLNPNCCAMSTIFPLLALLFFSCGQKNQTNDRAAKLDQFLSGQASHFKFNGNVLVAEDGEIIFQKSYGFADLENQRLLNDSSVFELASVSKQFTAAAILLLKDKGMLNLTDTLRHYFPELPYHNITIRHMLTHTSGLPDYFELMLEKKERNKIVFNNDMIVLLEKVKPSILFDPGSKWEYSNTAFVLLASIVEKISGQPYRQFMAENIFNPLNMHHTRIYNTRRSLKDTIANYAYGFIYDDNSNKYILPDNARNVDFVVYLDGIQGDGTVNSTTADLLKWDRAMKNSSLLRPETQKEMLQPHALADTTSKLYYGYGVMVEKTDFGNMIAHSGGWPGYITYLGSNTDKDQTYIVLSNNMADAPAIAFTLQNIIAGNEVIMPYEHKAISLDSSSLEKFEGKYTLKGNEFKLERKGATLFRVANGNALELIPESASKFYYSNNADKQIEFELDGDKKIKNTWMISTGVKTLLEKQ